MTDRIEILRRQSTYVIINKPIGADSEDKGEGSVPFLVRQALDIPYAAPVHRLDRAVGGAMLVSIDEHATARLCEQMQGGIISKQYICVCEGELSEDVGEMQDLLYFDRSRQKSFVAKKKRNGVKQASLEYSVLERTILESGKVLSLARVCLHTGRTHQIRVQFASRRHPLCGDGKYGSHDNRATLALHCLSIDIDGVRTECKPAQKYPFDLFRI